MTFYSRRLTADSLPMASSSESAGSGMMMVGGNVEVDGGGDQAPHDEERGVQRQQEEDEPSMPQQEFGEQDQMDKHDTHHDKGGDTKGRGGEQQPDGGPGSADEAHGEEKEQGELVAQEQQEVKGRGSSITEASQDIFGERQEATAELSPRAAADFGRFGVQG